MRNTLSLIILLGLHGFVNAVDDETKYDLKLPWGTYRGVINATLDEEIVVFKNVRFGAEPKRFGASTFPDWTDDSLQDSNRNTTCIQIDPKLAANPPAHGSPLEDPHELPAAQTEDCLFLDLYVPKWVYEEEAPYSLPVTVWVYGGGYAFGTKEQGGPFYTGYPHLRASYYNTIFITGNYRVGAFGWLAGNYMETAGLPNAGLYDQALLFEWVRKYIHLVKGEKEQVSAWGESAGGGSILHHLLREDGTKDPGFQSYVAQSPGFEWAWDNRADGKLDTMYRNFSRLAGCEFAYDIDCLRKADKKDLAKANQELYDLVRQTGMFPVGPAVDGKWIKTLASVAFDQGKYWNTNITGNIVSNVANEGILFVAKDVDNESAYDTYLGEFLPGDALAPQRAEIKKKYDCKNDILGYRYCVAKIVAHAVFTCNSRYLATAHPNNTFALEYEFPFDGMAFHGTDLIPEFISNQEEAFRLLNKTGEIPEEVAVLAASMLASKIAPQYQSYLASFSIYANPNFLSRGKHWPNVDRDGDAFTDVMQARAPLLGGSGWELVKDKKNTKPICNFWTGIAKSLVSGSSVDEVIVDSDFVYHDSQTPLEL